ncbi:MAG: TA system VapC family ribonuclease toxin [Acidimicrobiia bacterium]
MLVDANLLLYARDSESAFHDTARAWLTEQLGGPVRVGLPWPSLGAFVRIATHPRAAADPLHPREAWAQVDEWLASPAAWIPVPTDRHAEILGGLVARHELRANLVSDAHLAALAIEHGLELCSADTDFARFPELRWRNPIG